MNGGTCIDGVDSFMCSCPPNAEGDLCHCLLTANGKQCATLPEWYEEKEFYPILPIQPHHPVTPSVSDSTIYISEDYDETPIFTATSYLSDFSIDFSDFVSDSLTPITSTAVFEISVTPTLTTDFAFPSDFTTKASIFTTPGLSTAFISKSATEPLDSTLPGPFLTIIESPSSDILSTPIIKTIDSVIDTKEYSTPILFSSIDDQFIETSIYEPTHTATVDVPIFSKIPTKSTDIETTESISEQSTTDTSMETITFTSPEFSAHPNATTLAATATTYFELMTEKTTNFTPFIEVPKTTEQPTTTYVFNLTTTTTESMLTPLTTDLLNKTYTFTEEFRNESIFPTTETQPSFPFTGIEETGTSTDRSFFTSKIINDTFFYTAETNKSTDITVTTPSSKTDATLVTISPEPLTSQIIPVTEPTEHYTTELFTITEALEETQPVTKFEFLTTMFDWKTISIPTETSRTDFVTIKKQTTPSYKTLPAENFTNTTIVTPKFTPPATVDVSKFNKTLTTKETTTSLSVEQELGVSALTTEASLWATSTEFDQLSTVTTFPSMCETVNCFNGGICIPVTHEKAVVS